MVKLTDMGFSTGVVCETIVSTYNADGSVNAAPMGLKILDEEHLTLSIFNTASTCSNLKAKQCAAINLACNIEVFYKATFKEVNPDGKIPSDWFVKAIVVKAPKLRFAEAVIEVTAIELPSVGENRTEFCCKVERVDSSAKHPQVYCRAMPLTMEAIIHATRVQAFINKPQKQQEVTDLIYKIQHYADVVGRVAPNTYYTVVLVDLLERIDSWRAKP